MSFYAKELLDFQVGFKALFNNLPTAYNAAGSHKTHSHEIYYFTFVPSSISRCARGFLNCNPQNPEIATHAFDTPLKLHKQAVSLISLLMRNNDNVQMFILNRGLTLIPTYLLDQASFITHVLLKHDAF